uniref:Uncharacterized protein n=1 Tax=Megaselia scalaris TaxID=36166 RepID=T1H5D6_MEGSC
MGLLKADFKDIADVFMKLPKSNQDYILNKLFSIMEKDNFEYDVFYSDSYSIENAKKMFNDKLFVLFQISEEKLSSVPNYRLNPEFADNDNSAFEWLSEYEMSFIYPTEDTPDITTPIYTPDEEESTFSAIFVDYDDKTETNILETTISEDLENDVEIFTTTESPDEDYSEEDEEGQQEEEEEVEEFLPSGADDVDEEENDNELNLPNLVEE